MGASYTDGSGYASHAFLFSGGSMQDLGTLPGRLASVATAVNKLGQVVGYADTNGSALQAFLYSGGSMQSLGTGEACAINDAGQVVGETLSSSGAARAFLYSGGVLKDLNTLITTAGWTLEEATGINDSGQICGYGIGPGGHTEAFLLTRSSAIQSQWGVNGSGTWSTASNWTGGIVPGGLAQDTADFGTALTSGTATRDLG